jgi:hypothetical protein
MTANYRLNDEEIAAFIARGYHILHSDIDADVHRAVREQTRAAFGEGENPGNTVYEQAPAVQQVLAHPQVVGALSSILGPDYYMECHRHAHRTKPGQQAGGFHQDGTLRALKGWTRPWRYWHRPRKVLLIYFPQAVPDNMGPTTVVPGSQYYRQRPEDMEALECRITGGEGIMAIVNFACWHRAGANTSDRERIMLKFLFDRRSEPQAPSWDAVDRYDPGFDAKAQEWLGLDDGRLLCLPRAWQAMWNWLGNRGEECVASVSSTDELMAALGSAEEAVALEAAYGLGRQVDEAGASALLHRLRDGEEMEREMAALALSAAGSAAVPALRQALSDDDAWLRAMAVDLVGDLGRESLALLPEIGEALDDEDAWVRHNAAQALEIWGEEAEREQLRLVHALDDSEPFVRFNALGALMNMRLPAGRCTELLQKVSAQDAAQAQWRAADALRRLDHQRLSY